jgi:O-antigen ligase
MGPCVRVKRQFHPKGGNVPQIERGLVAIKLFCWPGTLFAERPMPLQARSWLEAHEAEASIIMIPRSKKFSGESTIVERTLLWAFIAGLGWCPFLFGSNVLLAWGINAVVFPCLVAIYELSLLIRGERHPVAIRQIKVPAALFAAVVLWILFQNATWTPAWFHHPIWQMAADALDQPIDGSISVDRELTSLALLRLITAASVFWIALQLCRDASRADLLLWSIAAIICAYAAYALVAFWLMPGRVLWIENPFRGHFVTSTFISPDSFAAYAGIGLIAFCGVIVRLYRNEFTTVGGSIRFRIATLIDVTGRKGVALLGGAVVILVALLLSGSRGGTAATAVGLLALGALTLRMRKQSSMAQRGVVIAFIGVLVGIAFLTYGDVLVGRITQLGFHDSNRLAVYVIAVRSILDAPLLGYGYGTFLDVFPMFRDHSVGTSVEWDKAHNTYLEVFQGLGLVVGGMLVASIVMLVVRCAKGALARQQNETIPCIAASAAFLVGAHSLVDFSLQIQAIGVTFMALLGAGVAQSESSRLMLGD